MLALKKAREWVKAKLKADKRVVEDNSAPALRGDSLFGIPDVPKGRPIEVTSPVSSTDTKPSPTPTAIEKAIERLREQTQKYR